MLKIALASAAVLLASPAVAASASSMEMVEADPVKIAKILQDEGYKVKQETDADGDPKLTSATGGYNYSIFFYGCEAHKNCTAIQFYAAFTTKTWTLERANEWNKAHRFGRAYQDKDGDAAVEFDLDMHLGGLPRALFVDQIELWDSTVAKYSAAAFAE